MAEARWICVGCGEPWDLDDVPPDEAECIYCGGEIDIAARSWRWAKAAPRDGLEGGE